MGINNYFVCFRRKSILSDIINKESTTTRKKMKQKNNQAGNARKCNKAEVSVLRRFKQGQFLTMIVFKLPKRLQFINK